VLYKEPWQSLIPVNVTCVRYSIFEREKHSPCQNPLPLVEVYGEGVMNDGNVCKWYNLFNGEGQMCTMKCDLDAHLWLLHDNA
jgi:hypothetical protein